MTIHLLERIMTGTVKAESWLKKWRWVVLGALAAGLIYFFAGGDTKVFVSDRLNFDSSTAPLRPESVQTLDELSAVLNASPATEVRLDGYTDKHSN